MKYTKKMSMLNSKGRIRIVSMMMACLLLFMEIAIVDRFHLSTVQAAMVDVASSTNIHRQSYSWNYASPIKSHLIYSNGEYIRIEYISDAIYVETYDSKFAPVSSKKIGMELPIFGGFYSSPTNYYLVFGQENSAQSDGCEVIRVVKYDKNWNRQGGAGLYGANTTKPFDAGSLRMTMNGNYLAIRTCHKMYQSSDGLNHQANLSMLINTANMSVVDSFSKVWNIDNGYSSHSFNQFIAYDGSNLVAVDHGDAYPRALVIGKYASANSVSSSYSHMDVVSIPGNIGANYTGMTVGGFEIGSGKYLIAETHVAYDANFSSNKAANIYIDAVSKDLSGKTQLALTNYSESSGKKATTPHLVRINSNLFLVLWQETSSSGGNWSSDKYGGIYYAYINGSGQLLGSVRHTSAAELSDCPPIVVNNQVIWYTTSSNVQNGAPIFCRLSLNMSNYTLTEEVIPTQIPITRFDISKTSLVMGFSDGYPVRNTLSVSVEPKNAAYSDITWISSNPAVATVNSSGTVTTVGNGTAQISAIAADGLHRVTCTVDVGKRVESIRVTSSESGAMSIGNTRQLSAVFLPKDAGDKSVTWTSDNTSVATVDANGKITAVGNGYANIIAVANDKFAYYSGMLKATYYVHVVSSSNTGSTGSGGANIDGNSQVVDLDPQLPETMTMYRLYNPNSGEHFYTAEVGERDMLTEAGWNFEGDAWTTYTLSSIPVYRLYNPNSGEHHYTTNEAERDMLMDVGWRYEGIGWYSEENQGTPLYRLYNPNATGEQEAGAHHYTKEVAERDYLISIGWNYEGVGWYGL